MRLTNCFAIISFIGLAAAAPPTKNTKDNKPIINSDLFTNDFLVYTSEHDIVVLTVPLNAITFELLLDANFNYTMPLYFVEADVNDKGQKNYKGLYFFKNGIVTKLLETGTDASASDDGTTQVYFSAKDGIYLCNRETNKIEKYGNITESLIGIAKTMGSDLIYVLTEDHDVYKVSDVGNKKEKLQYVKDAQQIVLDLKNNLYFYSKDKVPYVVTKDGIKKISGLPENPTYVQLIKPPIVVENGVLFAADDKIYIIRLDGTSELTEDVLKVKPKAYALEATIVQYYSYNKKIYELSLKKLREIKLRNEVNNIMEHNEEEFQEYLKSNIIR